MPLLAKFIGVIATFFVSIFSSFLGVKAALHLASFVAWVAILTAFVASVSGCLNLLYGAVAAGVAGGPEWLSRFMMGVGMFIPANAGGILSCMASVWIGAQVYKIRKTGLHHYSR